MEDALKKRRAQAEEQFTVLKERLQQRQEEAQQIERDVQEINTEMLKLQGEHRALQDLLEKPAVSPKPDVVDVDAAIKDKK